MDFEGNIIFLKTIKTDLLPKEPFANHKAKKTEMEMGEFYSEGI